jgi:hypothetical protein
VDVDVDTFIMLALLACMRFEIWFSFLFFCFFFRSWLRIKSCLSLFFLDFSFCLFNKLWISACFET